MLREGAALDVSGRWADLQGKGVASPWLGRLDGGRVTLDSPHGIAVAAGSLIDVFGRRGAAQGRDARGKGGDVTLRAGAPEVEGATGALALAGQLRGHGMAGGGTLTLETDGKVVIGAADALAYRQTHTQVGAQQPQPLLLDPSLLGAGFAKYDINGRDGLRVAEGATLDVAMPVYRYEPGNEATGQRPAPALLLAPVYQENPLKGRADAARRRDLTLRSQRIEDGADIDIGAGALVSVDPGRTIRLLGGGNSRITVDGALRAPGGRIEADIVAPASDVRDNPASRTHNRAIWIGGAATDVATAPPAAWTSTAAATARRRRAAASCWAARWTGTRPASPRAPVISPSWCARAPCWTPRARLAIDAPRGSRLGTLDLAGDGGQIVLKSSYGLFLDGDMRARAGGAGAAGGTLALALETPTFPLSVNAEDGVRRPRELILSQGTQASGLASDLAGQLDPALHHGAARCRRGSSRPAASATCRCWSTGFSVSTATWPCRPRKACASMPAVMP